MKWYEASTMIRNIPLTRYISSYYIGGGTPVYRMAYLWAEQLIIDDEKLTEEEVKLIANCATNGMFEMEESAKDFMKQFTGLTKSEKRKRLFS